MASAGVLHRATEVVAPDPELAPPGAVTVVVMVTVSVFVTILVLVAEPAEVPLPQPAATTAIATTGLSASHLTSGS
jgi:hypothetical protein